LYALDGFRLGPFYDIVAPSVYPRFRRTGLALKMTPGTNPHSLSDIGPKHLSLLTKSFGLNNAALELAVADLKRQLGAAKEAVQESKVGSTQLKKQLIDLMGKRWNGTFASIGSNRAPGARAAQGARSHAAAFGGIGQCGAFNVEPVREPERGCDTLLRSAHLGCAGHA
jgi:hypothetical protein